MIVYLLKWAISLLILLLLYQTLLASQPLHRFKRVYLLATLLIPLLAPLLTIEWPAPAVPLVPTRAVATPLRQWLLPQDVSTPGSTRQTVEWSWRWLYGLYGLGTILMLGRFVRNLMRIITHVPPHRVQPFPGVTLILLPGQAGPHTFLNYLFVSKALFEQGNINPELLIHELAHIRQRHSLDVLLIELVRCFGWFNPLLFWLKKAIQFNHECLADAAVVGSGGNIRAYQHLLLDAVSQTTVFPVLASTLSFQTTKQRLYMMTKQTTPARTWLSVSSSILLFGALTLVLVDSAQAQNAPLPDKPGSVPSTAITRREPRPLSAEEVKKKYGNDVFYGPDRKKAPVVIKKKADSLLAAGQPVRVYLPPPLRTEPTEAQWNDFKNSKKYGIWVDGKRRRDNPLAKYTRADIVHYWYSYVHKNARQLEGYLYQLELYTEAGYQKILQESEADPLLILEPNRAKVR